MVPQQTQIPLLQIVLHLYMPHFSFHLLLRVHSPIRIPKLIKCWGFKKIDEFCRERFCQARGSSGEHSEVVDRVGISNWRRIGIPEYSLIEDMIKCVNEIVKLEDEMDVKL